MKKNIKLMSGGFTLIELLAVLIILGVILAIIIPVTNGVINNSKQNAYDSQIDILLDQALKYSVNNNLGIEDGIEKTLQFEDLISDGLISELPTNPLTGSELEGCIVYKWSNSINQYEFSYNTDCKVAQISYNKMISGHDFNTKVTALSGFDTVTRIVFESTIDEGLDLSSTTDLSINQDYSIVGFISGNTLKIQNNGVILAHEDLGATYDDAGARLTNSMFRGMVNITEIDFKDNEINVFDTGQVINMTEVFSSTNSLTNLDLSNFNTSNVTTMKNMFIGLGQMANLDLSSFDTSKVTDMSGMFGYSGIKTINLSSFNTSNVTTMSTMFGGSSIRELDLSNFNTSNVTDMESMFGGTTDLINLDLSSFDTGKVVEMNRMFDYSVNLEYLDLSSFVLKDGVNIRNMFENCMSLTTAYAGTQDMANSFNSSYYKYHSVNFVVKP